MSSVSVFQEEHPSSATYWRSLVLFGRNVATYKFALARTLLDLANQNSTHINAEQLAIPYAKKICAHLLEVDRQGTSQESRFLQACRDYNQLKISYDQLISSTVKLGFNNVLDAFHNVNGNEISNRFFTKAGTSNSHGIILCDDLYKLKEIPFESNLDVEVEARWKLVETAWNLALSPSSLMVEHDLASGLLTIEGNGIRRRPITKSRHALNGYQKGKCFYCFADIDAAASDYDKCDIDHFIPHMLQLYTPLNLNGLWNLVLSCKKCNRGANGKHTRVPAIKYLERLNKRNNFLVNSHHPLRETIISQTGKTDEERRRFLQSIDHFAIEQLLFRWSCETEQEESF
jgi:5-methylcytosine-specific restriction endonuclease McrA